MATQVQFRGGTTTEHASFNGAAREVTVDTTKQTVVVQNGTTNGGFPLLGEKNADNVKLHLGGNGTTDTGDLTLYHDGSHSYINHVGTGDLILQTETNGDDIKIYAKDDIYINPQGGENGITLLGNGAVQLFYDGSGTPKLETTSGGVDITGTMMADGIQIQDSHVINCGNSQDLKIYHDGSNSYLKHDGYGMLYIQTGSSAEDIHIQGGRDVFIEVGDSDGEETAIRCIDNGAVQLFYDGSGTPKLETLSTGISVTGKVAPTGDVALTTTDNQLLRMGASNDLYIYHDGGNNWIDSVNNHPLICRAGTGILYLQGGEVKIGNEGNSEKYITAIENGGVELYWDNSKKLDTNSTGIKAYGNVDIQSAGDVLLEDNGKVQLGNSQDLQIYHDGNNSFVSEVGTGKLILQGNGPGVYIRGVSGEDSIVAASNGAVELYYDNSKKLETHTNGIVLTGVEGSGVNIYMYADEGDDNADKYRFAASSNGTLYVQNYAGAAWENNITATGNGAVELYYDNSKKLATLSNGVKIGGDATSSNLYMADADNGQRILHCNSNQIGFLTELGNWGSYTDDDGDHFAVTYTATSDQNLKKEITTTDLGLSFINKLNPVSFKWKETAKDKTHYGLVAQEVETVLKGEGKDETKIGFITNQVAVETGKDAQKYYGLNYSELISPLIKAVQELSAEVETLKTKVAALEAG